MYVGRPNARFYERLKIVNSTQSYVLLIESLDRWMVQIIMVWVSHWSSSGSGKACMRCDEGIWIAKQEAQRAWFKQVSARSNQPKGKTSKKADHLNPGQYLIPLMWSTPCPRPRRLLGYGYLQRGFRAFLWSHEIIHIRLRTENGSHLFIRFQILLMSNHPIRFGKSTS